MDHSDELLSPLVEAVAVVLREMAGVEAGPAEAADAPAAALIVVKRLRAATDGRLTLLLPADTAEALAGRVLRESGVVADPAMVRDCAGELANVVAGQLRALLAGSRHHFTHALPEVRDGTDAGPEGPALAVTFRSDAGPFAVRLGFDPGEEDGAGGPS